MPSYVLHSEDKPIPPTLPAVPGMFLPLVKEGVDDFSPDWVELQIGDAVKILLAAKKTDSPKHEGAVEQEDAATITEGLGQKP